MDKKTSNHQQPSGEQVLGLVHETGPFKRENLGISNILGRARATRALNEVDTSEESR